MNFPQITLGVMLGVVIGYMFRAYRYRVKFGVDEPNHIDRGVKRRSNLPTIPMWVAYTGRYMGRRGTGSKWITVFGIYVELMEHE